MASFPTSQPNLSNPSGSDPLNNPDHASQHGNANDEIEALATKVGTGASTPANNQFLVGNGAGTSAWQSLTSAQLASRISDETGSGALVFGTSPSITTPTITNGTLVTPTIADYTNANHDHGDTDDGGALVAGAIPNDLITSAMMQYGLVRNRQGSTTGDANWSTVGTNNTATDGKGVFIQFGSVATSSAGDTTVTFPTAFSFTPIVVATTYQATGNNSFCIVVSVTTTTVVLRTVTDGGAGSTQNAMWLAVGQ